jgi:hypothetical protein
MVKNGSIFRERLESPELRFRFDHLNLKNQSQITVNHRITSNQRSFSDSYVLIFFKKKVLRSIWNDWKMGVSLWCIQKEIQSFFEILEIMADDGQSRPAFQR